MDKDKGKKNEKSFFLRLSIAEHYKLKVEAAKSGKSIGRYILDALEKYWSKL